ncbi:sugar transferase [Phaeovulum vinaykumarii]|uniref:Sugar transferase involved in LPS biosynthesis (Colanic, teichoic acid) n=1 Tax=Phaeovulum vinaykumarii TaxID=407234 RepID=A0A1N7JNH6_9RHOB|nr:sugar transferase [Phaeovulum vinaykumarii]SIS50865.1 Sugar transferase involved in LPS biosynthesis (colanic, teichoic acid) [Phaeovulum vinaykumarii]SOB90461.1 lipopolysaccharide/colanic/teichoic acid biosynthesis glycosyltransferase [Phaeovulum vinaykumarii]
MTPTKRLFDILASSILIVLLAPLGAWIAWRIWRREGGPIFYLSERMQTPTRGFLLYKFRSMTPDDADSGVSGGDKSHRITPTGAWLRRTRLDELPQLINVLRGDISMVGPRPPLRMYVERFPEVYAEVLRSRPGLTGLASLHYHRHEALLVGRARSAPETDTIYCRACIPRKARLDLIYQKHANLCLDLVILFRTVAVVLR